MVVWLLPLLLTGCFPFHKKHPAPAQPAPPPIQQAPPPQTTAPPAPVATIPTTTPTDNSAAAVPAKKPKPSPAHRRSSAKSTQPAPPEQASAPPAATEQATAGTPGVSAIGQLSSGDSSDQRGTSDAIAAIERSLNGINRTLSDAEQKTAAQIREFLKQARAALNSGDVEGASTLAAKAKVLLSELIEP
jgi:outer membrane biosynthesis protein TonB